MYFNEREKLMMIRKGKITLTQLAKLMKCSISLLSMFERGQANLSDEKMSLYVKIVNMPYEKVKLLIKGGASVRE